MGTAFTVFEDRVLLVLVVLVRSDELAVELVLVHDPFDVVFFVDPLPPEALVIIDFVSGFGI